MNIVSYLDECPGAVSYLDECPGAATDKLALKTIPPKCIYIKLLSRMEKKLEVVPFLRAQGKLGVGCDNDVIT